MKSLTVRLPDTLAVHIDTESRRRGISRSDVVRERLQGRARSTRRRPTALDAIADLIGAVDHLPPDLSSRKKHHLKAAGYGRKRPG
jgi:Arc/MetJ-type ribon-helix-helix transcriptional regulator